MEEGGQLVLCEAWLQFEREEGRCVVLVAVSSMYSQAPCLIAAGCKARLN